MVGAALVECVIFWRWRWYGAIGLSWLEDRICEKIDFYPELSVCQKLASSTQLVDQLQHTTNTQNAVQRTLALAGNERMNESWDWCYGKSTALCPVGNKKGFKLTSSDLLNEQKQQLYLT